MAITNVAQLKAKPWTTEELAGMGIVVSPSGGSASPASTAAKTASALVTSSGSPRSSAGSSGSSGLAKVTTNTDLSLDPNEPWQTPEIASLENQKEQFASADRLLGDAEATLKDLREKNASWMKGEVPADVQQGLRSSAALSARSSGLSGSPAARNLQARDLGLTSMQIQESGMQRGGQIAELSKGLAAVREQRAQFLASLQESSKQFGANLSDQLNRTQLAHRELILKQDAFNAEQNMRLIELITQSNLGMFQLQVQAAGNEISDAGITGSFNTLQKQLQALLERSNSAAK